MSSVAVASASMEEMSSMTRQNVENARRGAQLVEQSADEFTRCDAALKDMVQSTDRILDSSQRVAKILKTIDEIAFNAAQGTEKVKVLADSIRRIGQQTTEIKGIVAEVSSASHQQSQGIDQVTQAIAQMEKVTQTTAATAEESAAASEELNAQAELSMNVVGQLQLLVGGAGAASVRAAHAGAAAGRHRIVPKRAAA